MKRPQLPFTRNAAVRMQDNLFGPPDPVYPVYWRGQGDRMRHARIERGLSIAEAANVLGLQPGELHLLEIGGARFSLADGLAMLRCNVGER